MTLSRPHAEAWGFRAKARGLSETLHYDWSLPLLVYRISPINRDLNLRNLNYFNITNINDAIKRTIDESEQLEAIIMDISPEANLDLIFRPLNNSRIAECILGKEKARLKKLIGHSSWLRIYAIKLAQGVYIITGGAIKLTATMQEREHTAAELVRIEKVRDFLLSQNIVDNEGFIDYIAEL